MGSKKDQSLYSAELNQFIRFLESAKQQYESCTIELTRQEQLKTDFLHLLELKCTSSRDRSRISKQLQKCLLLRRECKDTIALLEPLILFLNSDRGKFVVNQLPQLLGNMRKEEKRIVNRTYAPRAMTHEEFENALAPKEPIAAMEEAGAGVQASNRVEEMLAALQE